MQSFTNLPAVAAFSKALTVYNRPLIKSDKLRANHISILTAVHLLTKGSDYTTMRSIWQKLGKGMIRNTYDNLRKTLASLSSLGLLNAVEYKYKNMTFIHYSLTIKGNNTLHDLNKLINKYKKPRK